jgi:hypothetical protein
MYTLYIHANTYTIQIKCYNNIKDMGQFQILFITNALQPLQLKYTTDLQITPVNCQSPITVMLIINFGT